MRDKSRICFSDILQLNEMKNDDTMYLRRISTKHQQKHILSNNLIWMNKWRQYLPTKNSEKKQQQLKSKWACIRFSFFFCNFEKLTSKSWFYWAFQRKIWNISGVMSGRDRNKSTHIELTIFSTTEHSNSNNSTTIINTYEKS